MEYKHFYYGVLLEGEMARGDLIVTGAGGFSSVTAQYLRDGNNLGLPRFVSQFNREEQGLALVPLHRTDNFSPEHERVAYALIHTQRVMNRNGAPTPIYHYILMDKFSATRMSWNLLELLTKIEFGAPMPTRSEPHYNLPLYNIESLTWLTNRQQEECLKVLYEQSSQNIQFIGNLLEALEADQSVWLINVPGELLVRIRIIQALYLLLTPKARENFTFATETFGVGAGKALLKMPHLMSQRLPSADIGSDLVIDFQTLKSAPFRPPNNERISNMLMSLYKDASTWYDHIGPFEPPATPIPIQGAKQDTMLQDLERSIIGVNLTGPQYVITPFFKLLSEKLKALGDSPRGYAAAELVERWLTRPKDFKIEPTQWQPVLMHIVTQHLRFLSLNNERQKFNRFLQELLDAASHKNGKWSMLSIDQIFEGVCSYRFQSEQDVRVLLDYSLQLDRSEPLAILIKNYANYDEVWPGLARVGEALVTHSRPPSGTVAEIFDSPVTLMRLAKIATDSLPAFIFDEQVLTRLTADLPNSTELARQVLASIAPRQWISRLPNDAAEDALALAKLALALGDLPIFAAIFCHCFKSFSPQLIDLITPHEVPVIVAIFRAIWDEHKLPEEAIYETVIEILDIIGWDNFPSFANPQVVGALRSSEPSGLGKRAWQALFDYEVEHHFDGSDEADCEEIIEHWLEVIFTQQDAETLEIDTQNMISRLLNAGLSDDQRASFKNYTSEAIQANLERRADHQKLEMLFLSNPTIREIIIKPLELDEPERYKNQHKIRQYTLAPNRNSRIVGEITVVEYRATRLADNHQVWIRIIERNQGGSSEAERQYGLISNTELPPHVGILCPSAPRQANTARYDLLEYDADLMPFDMEMDRQNWLITGYEALYGFVVELLNAVQHLHEHKIVLGLVRPEDIFLKDKHPVLLRFDYARSLNTDLPGGQDFTTNPFEIPEEANDYIAPEIPQLKRLSSPKTDLFALGVLLYELLTQNRADANTRKSLENRESVKLRVQNDLFKPFEPIIASWYSATEQRKEIVALSLPAPEELEQWLDARKPRSDTARLPLGTEFHSDGRWMGDSVTYRSVSEAIGHGGSSTVYEVESASVTDRLALKVYDKADIFADDERRNLASLMRDWRYASALPNILILHNTGVFEDKPFLVFPLMTGGTLRDKLQKLGHLDVGTAVDFTIQLLEVLKIIHPALDDPAHNGFVHRDIKPENVFLRKEPGINREQIVLGDFNLAHSREHSWRAGGSEKYMHPNTANFQHWQPDPDTFATGVMLYELITGKHPYGGQPPNASRPPEVEMPNVNPEFLKAVVWRGADSRRYFRTAQEFLTELKSFRNRLIADAVTESVQDELPTLITTAAELRNDLLQLIKDKIWEQADAETRLKLLENKLAALKPQLEDMATKMQIPLDAKLDTLVYQIHEKELNPLITQMAEWQSGEGPYTDFNFVLEYYKNLSNDAKNEFLLLGELAEQILAAGDEYRGLARQRTSQRTQIAELRHDLKGFQADKRGLAHMVSGPRPETVLTLAQSVEVLHRKIFSGRSRSS
jgi:serine/threonine protein kinase